MTGRDEHVLSFALEHPWALTRPMGRVVAQIIARHIAGVDASAEIAALVPRTNVPQPVKGSAVAVIPIYGVIAPRMNLLSDFSGGTTFEALTGQLHDALANDAVKTIVFDVDSPGGSVAGATEFAREVLKARAQKPIIAVAQYLCGSAAYWVMSCATELVAAPSAKVGASEVYMLRDDLSEALATAGIKREVIFAGSVKPIGVDDGPLSDDEKAYIKALCETFYSYQVADIAKGRGVTDSTVRSRFSPGRALAAADALAVGMIDKIGTLTETLARVMTTAPAAGARAHTIPKSTTDTTQEPVRATVQDQQADVAWQNARERELLELQL